MICIHDGGGKGKQIWNSDRKTHSQPLAISFEELITKKEIVQWNLGHPSSGGSLGTSQTNIFKNSTARADHILGQEIDQMTFQAHFSVYFSVAIAALALLVQALSVIVLAIKQ